MAGILSRDIGTDGGWNIKVRMCFYIRNCGLALIQSEEHAHFF